MKSVTQKTELQPLRTSHPITGMASVLPRQGVAACFRCTTSILYSKDRSAESFHRFLSLLTAIGSAVLRDPNLLADFWPLPKHVQCMSASTSTRGMPTPYASTIRMNADPSGTSVANAQNSTAHAVCNLSFDRRVTLHPSRHLFSPIIMFDRTFSPTIACCHQCSTAAAAAAAAALS